MSGVPRGLGGRRRLAAFALCIPLLLFALVWRTPAVQAAATTITVLTTGDSATVTACTTSCPTLRDAAAEANSLTTSSGSPVTIVLPSGTTVVSDGFILLGSATNLDFTLTGPTTNPANAVIQASGSTLGEGTLVVETVPGIASTFQNLTITGGNANGGTYGGGAILTGWDNQTTTIINCVFTNNSSASSAGGGAVASEGGPGAGASLTITGSTFTGNSTSLGPGGAVVAENNAGTTGQVTLTGDTFSNNIAASPAANGGAFGGAAQVLSASLTVSRSVFQNNAAQITGAGTPASPPSGGALYVASSPSASITLSTFVGNSTSASGRGGAIFNNTTPLTLTYSRLVGNTTNGGYGDAVVNETNGGSVSATHDWWGQNAGPLANEVNNDPTQGGAAGAIPATAPNLELELTASPSTVQVGGTSTLTADLYLLSNGSHASPSSLNGLASFAGTVNGQNATFVNAAATGTFTGTTPGPATVSAHADNQTVTTVITVQAPLPVTVSGIQTFGSSSPSFTAAPTSGTLPAGVALSGTATCSTVNSGTPISSTLAAGSYTIDARSCSGLSLSGPNAADYTLTLTGGTFAVNPAALQVTAAGSQTFGSSSPTFSPQVSLPPGVTLSGTLTCTTVNGGTPINSTLAAGSYTLDAGSCSGLSLSGANAGDYTLSLTGGTFTVNPAAVPVTVSGSQTFGSTSPAFTAVPTSPLPSGVTLSGTATCATVNSGTAISSTLAAGSYTIDAGSCSGLSLSGQNAGDYALSPAGGTFTVSPAVLPVTVSGSQTFGSSSPSFTAAPTSGSLPAGVTLSGTATCTTVNGGTPISSTLAAGSYTVDAGSCGGLSLSGQNAGDYTPALAGGTFTVNPGAVQVTVSGSQTFGSSAPVFTAAPTSGSLPADVTLSGTGTCATVNGGTPISSTLAAGSYTIDAGSCSGLSLSGSNAGDYTLSLAGATFTVSPSALAVTVSGTQTFGSSSPTFAAAPTSGSLPSGVALSGTATCSTVNSGTPISGTLGAGSYTIDAASCSGLGLSGPNAGDYALALTGGAFMVTPAPLSVTVSGSQTFGSSAPSFTAAPTSGSLPSGVTLSGTATCATVDSGTVIGSTLAAGSYTVDAGSCSGLSLSGPNAADYTLSLSGGTFMVSPAGLQVTATGSQVFGSSSPIFTPEVSLPSGVTLSGTLSCATVNGGTPISSTLAAGSYTIDAGSCSGLSLSGPNAGDYTLAPAAGPFTVSPAPLAVTVSGSQTFGSSSPIFTAAPASGSPPAGVTLSGTATCTTVDSGTPISGTLPAGSYTVDAGSCTGLSLSGPNAGDYTLSLAGGPFTVSPAALQVTATGSETFGSPSPIFTPEVTPPSGVTLTGTLSCSTVDSGTPISSTLGAGSYTIDAASCSGLSLSGQHAGDYTLALSAGPFVVTPQALAVSVVGTQTFGSSTPAFTATPVSALPAGVTLTGTVDCTTVNSGTPISNTLAAGSYSIDGASCSGLSLSGANAADYTPAPTGGSFVVSQSGTTITVAVTPQNPTAGQTVTFAVTVSGDPPSGTVTFRLGSTTLGTAQLNSAGQATFSTSSLPAGTDTVIVSYGGDRDFAPSSTPVTVQVAALTAASSSGTTSGTTLGTPPTLAATGSGIPLTVLGGLLLVLAGAALLVASSRRRTGPQTTDDQQ